MRAGWAPRPTSISASRFAVCCARRCSDATATAIRRRLQHKDALAPEIAWAEQVCADGFVTGEPSAADYSIYPWLAMLRRLEERQPDHGFRLPASLRRYMGVVESLPFVERTIPPHWK